MPDEMSKSSNSDEISDNQDPKERRGNYFEEEEHEGICKLDHPESERNHIILNGKAAFKGIFRSPIEIVKEP